MKLVKLGMILFMAVSLAACAKPHSHDEREAIAVTEWTERTELFAEYRPLVVKNESAFAVHLTDLNGFQAVNEGKVTLIFKNQENEFSFTADAPTNPGIFRPVANISEPGKYQLTLLLQGALEDKYELGEVEVYPNLKSMPHSHEEETSSGISFLKEQQWKGGFNVEAASEKELHEIVKARGRVRAPLSESIAVVAPATGTLMSSSQPFPLMGAQVEANKDLAQVRSETENKTTPVQASASGVISVIHAVPGDLVEKGRKLFDVMDVSTVWVEARIFEADAFKLGKDISAVIHLPENDKTLETNKLISVGGTLDVVSRTMPVVFEVDNAKSDLRIGSSVALDIRVSKSGKGVVIPTSALVDEDGKMVAYVQVEGESFERRELKLGVREGNWVQIVEGIKAGERVVTEGAYSIRLMSASSQVPAHGHAH